MTPNPLKKENKTIQEASGIWLNIFRSTKLRQPPKSSSLFSSKLKLPKAGCMGDSNHNIMQCFIPREKKTPKNKIGLKATEINVTSILKEILEEKAPEKVTYHLEDTKMISNNEYGFVEKKSC